MVRLVRYFYAILVGLAFLVGAVSSTCWAQQLVDVAISKERDPAILIAPGRMLVYKLNYGNNTPFFFAHDIIIRDTLPANTTYISVAFPDCHCTPTFGSPCQDEDPSTWGCWVLVQAGPDKVVLHKDRLASFAFASVEITVRVDDDAAPGAEAINTVRITTIDLESNLDNNEFTLQETVTSVISTKPVTLVTKNGAQSGGDIIYESGAEVTARGVCWSTAPKPTTANECTSDGTGSGSFASTITGLQEGTKYYLRAYATYAIGTTYGDSRTFTTTPLFSLADAIMVLKVVAGIDNGQYQLYDLDGDGKIGMEEAIYIFQKVSGLR